MNDMARHPGNKKRGVRDERDGHARDPEEVNSQDHFTIHAVFAVDTPLPDDTKVRDALVEELTAATADVTVRGWYDVAGFRAEADVMVWMYSQDVRKLQDAYHRVRDALLAYMTPVWSVIGSHRPAEFNRAHIPAIIDNFGPRNFIAVYPFVRSYDWYVMDEAERSQMLKEHGKSGRHYPDVLASTLSTFALSDYEWILAFESDDINRLVDAMRHQRATRARMHVREEIPFFTGPRLELADLIAKQPKL
ncbi:MAG: chlorite dismutase family protein [Bowdeniella nasicola]|nr:chlorite dismutase family protein [Bowdeniella nasicola]